MRHTASPPFDTRAAAAELARRDRRLGRLIARVGECRLAVAPARVSPYAALAEAIVYQQLHGRAAAAIWRRLTTSFGRSGAPAAYPGGAAARVDVVGRRRPTAAGAGGPPRAAGSDRRGVTRHHQVTDATDAA